MWGGCRGGSIPLLPTMKYVYTLEASGLDAMLGDYPRTIKTSTCFATKELAESRIEKFRASIIANMQLCEKGIEIKVIPHEVIYE